MQIAFYTEARQQPSQHQPTATKPGTDYSLGLLLCHAAAVQNSPRAGLNCCVYTYADCLLH